MDQRSSSGTVVGDLTDASSVEKAFSLKPEAVIHLGAQQVSGRTPDKMMDVNVGGTRRVFQAAFQAGVSRAILMSSALCMGFAEAPADLNRSPAPVNERHGWAETPEIWHFAYSKILAEREAQWAAIYGMDVVICNPFMVAGSGDHSRRRTGLISRFAANPPQYLVKGGINIIDIKDVVHGILQALLYGKKGERYLLCGANVSFQELFQLLAELTGMPAPTLQLPQSLSSRFLQFKAARSQIFSAGALDQDLLLYAGKYFYYDDSWSRLSLRLPPPVPLKTTLLETLNWNEEFNEAKIDLPAA